MRKGTPSPDKNESNSKNAQFPPLISTAKTASGSRDPTTLDLPDHHAIIIQYHSLISFRQRIGHCIFLLMTQRYMNFRYTQLLLQFFVLLPLQHHIRFTCDIFIFTI